MLNAVTIFQCQWCHHISQDAESHREHLRRSGCIKRMARDQLSQQILEQDVEMLEEAEVDLDLDEETSGDYDMEDASEEGKVVKRLVSYIFLITNPTHYYTI